MKDKYQNERPNRDKLEAIFRNNDESEEAKQFIAEEYERCKDPYYFYMNYWQTTDEYGVISPPNPMTREEWDARTKYYEEQRYRYKPRTTYESYIRKAPLLTGRHSNLQKEVFYVVPTDNV